MKLIYIWEVRNSEFSEIFLRFMILSEECRKLSWIKSRSILSSASITFLEPYFIANNLTHTTT